MTEIEEAQNPETTAGRLEELAKSYAPNVAAAVAQNPSTPTGALLSLSSRFPAQFLENPVLPLLLLEQPNFAVSIPGSGLIAMLGLPSLPEWLLSVAVHHRDYSVREVVARNERLSLAQLQQLAKDKNERTLLALIDNPSTPAALLGELASNKSSQVCTAIVRRAMNPHATVEVLLALSWGRERIRIAIAQNTKTPSEVLARYASDPNGDVRRSIAKNPMTPTAILQQLRQDKNREIRDAVKQQLQDRRQRETDP